MDPLSVTASTIGIATLAWQSCKAVYQLVDGLKEAPKAIAHSKKLLSETQSVCDKFGETIKGSTRHSTDSRFSNRDRRRTSEDILGLDGRFTAQEAALVGLEKQLRERQTALQAVSLDVLGDGIGDIWSAAERDSSVEQIAKLREVCGETLSTTRAKRTGQSFGDMKVDKSMAYQGIVGTAPGGVEQLFGKLTATDGSTAAQGQMDTASFAMMFGRR
ncbi:hypothetical protein G7Y89_g9442 [Cudoniella acicularis]|uniref:Fungal N-terminal domain-containing protein n=1 Tax=Cudoniella acicularis TaxID=354080 RepID=A0A8H4W1W1_9HELO|nr:hypothetical protein G7Y89_g9442 [Cudoniella acicularis]